MTTTAPPAPLVEIDCNQLSNEGLAWANRAEVGDLLPGTRVDVHDVPSGTYGTAEVDSLSRDYVYLQVDWGSLRQIAVSDDDPPEWMVWAFALPIRAGRALSGWLAVNLRSFRRSYGAARCAREGQHKDGDSFRYLPPSAPGMVTALVQCRRCGRTDVFDAPRDALAAQRRETRLIRVYRPEA